MKLCIGFNWQLGTGIGFIYGMVHVDDCINSRILGFLILCLPTWIASCPYSPNHDSAFVPGACITNQHLEQVHCTIHHYQVSPTNLLTPLEYSLISIKVAEYSDQCLGLGHRSPVDMRNNRMDTVLMKRLCLLA